MEWYNMTYSEIMNISDKELKIKYRKKYMIGIIWFINPLYDSLTKKEQNEYDEFDKNYEKPMYQKVEKLKEIIGEEKAKQIVHKRMDRYKKC